MYKIASFTLVATTVFAPLSLPAFAETPTAVSTHLLPLEARVVESSYDPTLLESVATDANAAAFGSEENAANVFDLLDSPLLEGLVGENGEVNLPLGITVFSALGDPAVGFGGQF